MSTYFETEGSSSGRRLYVQLCYGMHGAKKNSLLPNGQRKIQVYQCKNIKEKFYKSVQLYGITKHAT
jgi:hypothetical protein